MSEAELIEVIREIRKTQRFIANIKERREKTDEDFRFLDMLEEKLPTLQDNLSIMLSDERVVASNRDLVNLINKARSQEQTVAEAKAILNDKTGSVAENKNIVKALSIYKRENDMLTLINNAIDTFISDRNSIASGLQTVEKLVGSLREDAERKCGMCEAAKKRLADVTSSAAGLSAAPVAAADAAPVAAAPAAAKKGLFGFLRKGGGRRKTRRHSKTKSKRQTRSRR